MNNARGDDHLAFVSPPSSSGRALRAGLPFGVVMATAVSSLLARSSFIPRAASPLAWLAALQIVWIVTVGAWRHRSEFTGSWRSWWTIGPPHEHDGVLTVPLGLSALTTDLATYPHLATRLVFAVLVLAYVSGWGFVARFVISVLQRRSLDQLEGSWFLAPAVLAGLATASVAYGATTHPSAHVELTWSAMTLAILGVVGYVMTLGGALVVRRHVSAGRSRGVTWWISAGCGGLVAASLVRAFDSADHVVAHRVVQVMNVVATSTLVIGLVLLVMVVARSVHYVITSRHSLRDVPWTPTFSLGVVALGAIGVGTNEHVHLVSTLGTLTALATLSTWIATTFVVVGAKSREWTWRQRERQA